MQTFLELGLKSTSRIIITYQIYMESNYC